MGEQGRAIIMAWDNQPRMCNAFPFFFRNQRREFEKIEKQSARINGNLLVAGLDDKSVVQIVRNFHAEAKQGAISLRSGSGSADRWYANSRAGGPGLRKGVAGSGT